MKEIIFFESDTFIILIWKGENCQQKFDISVPIFNQTFSDYRFKTDYPIRNTDPRIKDPDYGLWNRITDYGSGSRYKIRTIWSMMD